jgi:hypothetical protein
MWFLFAFLLFASWTCGQEAIPTFEVASVKLNHSGPEAPNGFFPSPGRLRVVNMTLEQFIQAAYHIRTGMLFGTAAWMQTERFDIDARAAGRSSFDEGMVMLRAVLVDRFQLRFHRETRELKMQVLVVGKGGPKFQGSKDQDEKEQVNIRPTEISGTAIPFAHFVPSCKRSWGIRSSMKPRSRASTIWRSDTFAATRPAAMAQSVFAALADLGLKLEARRAPAEVFVVDSAERPREN